PYVRSSCSGDRVNPLHVTLDAPCARTFAPASPEGRVLPSKSPRAETPNPCAKALCDPPGSQRSAPLAVSDGGERGARVGPPGERGGRRIPPGAATAWLCLGQR